MHGLLTDVLYRHIHSLVGSPAMLVRFMTSPAISTFSYDPFPLAWALICRSLGMGGDSLKITSTRVKQT